MKKLELTKLIILAIMICKPVYGLYMKEKCENKEIICYKYFDKSFNCNKKGV